MVLRIYRSEQANRRLNVCHAFDRGVLTSYLPLNGCPPNVPELAHRQRHRNVLMLLTAYDRHGPIARLVYLPVRGARLVFNGRSS